MRFSKEKSILSRCNSLIYKYRTMTVLIAYIQQTTKTIIINTHTETTRMSMKQDKIIELTSVVAWGVVSVVGSVAGSVEVWATELVAV